MKTADIGDRIRAIRERYDALYRAHTDRYRELLFSAMPQLGKTYCFHLCHNWGNDEARRLLARYEKTSSNICKRQSQEYKRAWAKIDSK